MIKIVRLQHRAYFGADHTTKYTQHRINIPDNIIKKLGWLDDENVHLKIICNKNNKTNSLKITLN